MTRSLEVRLFWGDTLIASDAYPVNEGLHVEVSSALGASYVLPEIYCSAPVLLATYDGQTLEIAGEASESRAVVMGPLTFLVSAHRTPEQPARLALDTDGAPAMAIALVLHVALLGVGMSSPHPGTLSLDRLSTFLVHLPPNAEAAGRGPVAAETASAPPEVDATPRVEGAPAGRRATAATAPRATDARGNLLALLGGVAAALGESSGGPRYDTASALAGAPPVLPEAQPRFGAAARPGATCEEERPCLHGIPQGGLGTTRAGATLGELAERPVLIAEIALWSAEPSASELRIRTCYPADCLVTGALGREVVRRAIRAHRNQISYCYERELGTRTDLEGRVETSFVIAPNGTVSNVTATSTDLPAVADCVARTLGRIRFPESPGVTGVTYPFAFSVD